jgi:hypothetical protein
VLGRHGMINATDTALRQRPEPLDGVRVDISAYVHLLRVVDSMMLVPSDMNSRTGSDLCVAPYASSYFAVSNVLADRPRSVR